MAKSSIDKRRRIRALEAKRDALMESKNKNSTELVKIRAELKQVRTL
jgi:hypothetical protein